MTRVKTADILMTMAIVAHADHGAVDDREQNDVAVPLRRKRGSSFRDLQIGLALSS